MTIYSDVQKSLETRLNSSALSYSIAWPNVPFTPIENQPWIRPTLLSAPASLLTLGSDQANVGVYQVDIFMPADRGPRALNEALSTLYSHFKEEMTLTNTATSVYLREVSVSAPTRQDAWYVANLSINFRYYSS